MSSDQPLIEYAVMCQHGYVMDEGAPTLRIANDRRMDRDGGRDEIGCCPHEIVQRTVSYWEPVRAGVEKES